MTNTAEKLTLPLFMVKYNGDLLISTGRSRFETSWKNKTMSWAALLNKLSRSMETTETHAEYMKMSKEQQDKIKDIGGFVGGHLRDGRRKTGYVTARQLLTLDLDFPPAEFWDNIIDNLEIDNALAVYSTHKHTKAKPRYRLIMPLDREVTPDEYEAIARKIAEAKIPDLWPVLVGNVIASYTTKIELRTGGRLFVHLSSSVARNEVFMRRSALMDAINEASGIRIVSSVIVK